MKFFINGDDMGITAGASKSMLAAWAAGALDGFSVIANGDALDEVQAGLLRHPDRPARIAVHFNLTEGRASAPPATIPRLVDAQGVFRRGFVSCFLKGMFSTSSTWNEVLQQVEIECRAQIRAVRSRCGARALQAVDGHNHIHMIPGFFSAVAKAARAEGVPEIRVSREPFYLATALDLFRPFWWINLVKHVLLRLLSRKAARIAAAEGLRFPRFLVGVLYTGRMTAARARRGIAAAGEGDGDVEVVFHVGRSDANEATRWNSRGLAAFHVSPRRSMEYDELLKWRSEGGAIRPTDSSPGSSP